MGALVVGLRGVAVGTTGAPAEFVGVLGRIAVFAPGVASNCCWMLEG